MKVAGVAEMEDMKEKAAMTGVAVMTVIADDIREDTRCLEGVNRLISYVRPPYSPYGGGC